MPRLPGFCRACGAIFASPLRAAEIGAEAAFELPVTCPECGGSGSVPPEILARVARAVTVLLRAGDVPEDQWRAVLDVLREAEEGDQRIDLVSRLHERAPELSAIAASVPGDAPGQWRGYVPVLEAAREVVEEAPEPEERAGAPEPEDGAVATEPEPVGPEELEGLVSQVLERALEEHGASRQRSPEDEERTRARRRYRETGRNDPCPCGSGEKYKACHWEDDLRLTRG